MVFDGLKRAEAAQKAGLTDNALYIAMRKPEVCAFMNSQMGVKRSSAAARTIAKAEILMDDAKSESVQTQNLQWLAAIAGVSPITKSESVIDHKGLQPGLVMNLIIGAVQQPDALLIDGQTHEHGSQHVINGLPQPVPHPSMRNALPKPALPGDSQGPTKTPRGAK